MSDEPRLTEQDRDLELTLGRLRPARGQLHTPKVLLEAVRRAKQREVWLWRGVAAALGAGLVLALLLRPTPPTREKVVLIPTPPMPTPQPKLHEPPAAVEPRPITEPDSDLAATMGDDYLTLRNRVLALGLRGLPPPPEWAPPPHSEQAGSSAAIVPSPEPDSLLNRFRPFAHGVRS